MEFIFQRDYSWKFSFFRKFHRIVFIYFLNIFYLSSFKIYFHFYATIEKKDQDKLEMSYLKSYQFVIMLVCLVGLDLHFENQNIIIYFNENLSCIINPFMF